MPRFIVCTVPDADNGERVSKLSEEVDLETALKTARWISSLPYSGVLARVFVDDIPAYDVRGGNLQPSLWAREVPEL